MPLPGAKHGKAHGDAVVVVARDLGPMQAGTAAHTKFAQLGPNRFWCPFPTRKKMECYPLPWISIPVGSSRAATPHLPANINQQSIAMRGKLAIHSLGV